MEKWIVSLVKVGAVAVLQSICTSQLMDSVSDVIVGEFLFDVYYRVLRRRPGSVCYWRCHEVPMLESGKDTELL